MRPRHAVPLTSITLRFVSASHFGTHLISSISLSFHTLTGTPFCNPFVFMVFHLMGGVYPRSPAFQWSSSDAPKSFICNTYAPPRKCCKQKTYGRAKSFSCNTYKKEGGSKVLWLTSILLTLTLNVSTWQRFNALFIRSFRSLLKECFTNLLHSQGSALFLRTAGVYPNNSHSGIPLRFSARECASGPLPFPHRCILFVPRPTVRFSHGPPGIRSVGMANDNSGANHPELPQAGFLSRTIFATDHKTIGLNYLWLALFSVFLGMAMSLLMRIHLVWPSVHLPFLSSLGDSPDRFVALTTLHGSLMVFLVLTAAPQAGFGNYFLPLQIGAREMAFPTLNLLAFWATVASLLGLTSTFFIPPRPAITLWIASVAIFCVASLLNALNFSVTTIDLRAPGMTLPRLPLTVWAWFINAILCMLIFSILLAACVCLLSDRLSGAGFFASPDLPASLSGLAASYNGQRLFWFFAQAEVYVA